MNDKHHTRLAGGLIIAATLGSLVLMLHHPTSLDGPDDGLLMGDWTNSGVHGGMIACLLMLRFGFSDWALRLGRDHASVRAGAMAFDAGMTAFIAAALVNGFAAHGLLAAQADPADVRLQITAFGALNRALANFGMVLTAVAMALWAVRMLRLDALTRIAGAVGIAVALAAAAWMVVGQGAFGLYPATAATVLFGAWSILVASRMMRDEPRGNAG
ncbi:hypothetical protein [Brevundimonas sp.]|uniref:hypothetical protein n=1 Tax=Brevundimonas sp. TaxID=1871086 RepID=UPI002FCBA48E